MTEDREQYSGEDKEQYGGDREQYGDDVEGHGWVGQTAGQQIDATDDDDPDVEGHSFTGQAGAGQQITATDDDDPDVEGHSFIGANVEPSDTMIGANTPEPSDQQTGG